MFAGIGIFVLVGLVSMIQSEPEDISFINFVTWCTICFVLACLWDLSQTGNVPLNVLFLVAIGFSLAVHS